MVAGAEPEVALLRIGEKANRSLVGDAEGGVARGQIGEYAKVGRQGVAADSCIDAGDVRLPLPQAAIDFRAGTRMHPIARADLERAHTGPVAGRQGVILPHRGAWENWTVV